MARLGSDGDVTLGIGSKYSGRGFDKAVRGVKTFSKTAMKEFRAVKKAVFSLKGAIVALGAGYAFKRFVGSIFEARSTTEGLQVRLQHLLGSVSEGSRLFDELSSFAGRVPFEFENIMAAGTQLAGVMKGGVSQIMEWMPMIGDLAAVAGVGIEKATEQVTRMYSAGAASADMFRERGILAMMGFTAGVSYSTEETTRMMKEAWLKVNSQFRGTTGDLAKTWHGLTSMLTDAWFIFRNQVAAAGIFNDTKKDLEEFLNKIKEWKESGQLDLWAKDVSDALISIKDAIIDLLPTGKLLLDWAIAAGRAFKTLGEGIGTIAAKIAGADIRTALERINDEIAAMQAQAAFDPFIDYTKELNILFRRQAALIDMNRKAIIRRVEAAIRGSRGLAKQLKSLPPVIKKETEAHAKAEAKIVALILATEKLTAGKEQMIVMMAWEYEQTGATADQVERYSAALRRQFEIKEQLALQEEQERARKELAGMGDNPLVTPGTEGMTELERTVFEYEQKLQAQQEYDARVLQLMAARNATQAEMEREYAVIQMRYADAATRYKKNMMMATLQDSASLFYNLYVLTGSSNKKLFKLYQGFAIAHAIIDTYRAGLKAFAEVPYPYNFVAMAAVIAAGLVKVKKIKDQKPGGGGSMSAGGGGAPSYGGGSSSSYSLPARTVETKERPQIVFKIEKIELLDENSVALLMARMSRMAKDYDVELIATSAKEVAA